jgi:hypothetical protein
MPERGSVTIRIKYNGYEHICVGFLGQGRESTEVVILGSQLPRGYSAEHGAHQFDVIFETHCLEPDPSGKSEWVATEILDLDEWAKGGRM